MTEDSTPTLDQFNLTKYNYSNKEKTTMTVANEDTNPSPSSESLIARLSKLQKNLIARKDQQNNFGKYNYRNAEEILKEAKKYIADDELLTITDNLIEINGRFFIQASATFTIAGDSCTADSYAAINFGKKGMDDSQVCGSASSYAKKYALQNLLICSSEPDADSHDNRSGVNDMQSMEELAVLAKAAGLTKKQFESDIKSITKNGAITNDSIKTLVEKYVGNNR